jgi:hypothetical protein
MIATLEVNGSGGHLARLRPSTPKRVVVRRYLIMKLAFAVAALSLVCGCNDPQGAVASPSAKPGDRADLGHERQDCRADKTCEPGLWCLSNLCVRPPGADCKLVAEELASIDLGNYAEPETREPVVAKYKDQCDKLMISKDEGACLDKAHDRWAAAQCVPRLFPDMASTSSNDCKLIGAKIKAAIEKQANYVNNPQMKPWFDTTIKVVTESCEKDAWPDALKKCVLAADAPQNPMYFQNCTTQMPPTLQQQLQQRMNDAYSKMQRP